MTQKKPFGRPKVDSQSVTLRLPTAVIEQIDDLRREEPDVPTRPEMIRRIIALHLEKLPDQESD